VFVDELMDGVGGEFKLRGFLVEELGYLGEIFMLELVVGCSGCLDRDMFYYIKYGLDLEQSHVIYNLFKINLILSNPNPTQIQHLRNPSINPFNLIRKCQHPINPNIQPPLIPPLIPPNNTLPHSLTLRVQFHNKINIRTHNACIFLFFISFLYFFKTCQMDVGLIDHF
jgi:hypothetical protein